MQQIPRHTDYRASGLAWVGDIPSHWLTRRNRFLFRKVDSRSVHGQETHLSMSQVHGLVPSQSLGRKSLQSESYAGGKLVAESDLVLNRLKAHLGVFARAKQTGVISPDYSVFRSKSDVSVPYCEMLFKTPFYVAEFRRRTKGIVEGFWRLYTDDFYDVSALIPPRTEQDQIVAYLRAQDVHIARLIKAKRELIGLLTEQKLRIIDHAVTRGLDASVALKPSGIEWLVDVPKHWKVRRLKFSCSRSAVYGANIPATHYSYEGVRFLRTTDIFDDGRLKAEGVFLPAKLVRDYMLTNGDILVSRSGTIGRSFLYDSTKHGPCAYAGYLVRFTPAPELHSQYLFYFTKTRGFADFIKVNAISTTIENLNGDKYANMHLPIPPHVEQIEICQQIDLETKPINDAIQRAEDEIKLIREYRDRQIADVVTGQV